MDPERETAREASFASSYCLNQKELVLIHLDICNKVP